MSTIITSQIPSLAALRILPLPTRPMKGMTVLRVPAGDVTVAVDAKGRIYSSQAAGGTKQYRDLSSNRIKYTIDGLAKLGVLSKDAVAEHQAARIRDAQAEELDCAARDVALGAARLGLKLTNAQAGRIDKALGGNARAAALVANIKPVPLVRRAPSKS